MWSNKAAANRIAAAAERGKHRISPKRENYWAPKAPQTLAKSPEMKGYKFDPETMTIICHYDGHKLVNELRGVSIFKNDVHIITVSSCHAAFQYIDTAKNISSMVSA